VIAVLTAWSMLSSGTMSARCESPLRGGHAPWSEEANPPATSKGLPEFSTAKRRTPVPTRPAYQSAASKVIGDAPLAKRAKPRTHRPVRPVGYETSDAAGAPGAAAAPSNSSGQVNATGQPTDRSVPAPQARPGTIVDSSVAAIEELKASAPQGDNFPGGIAPAPQEDLVRESPDDLEERRARFRSQMIRPFKKMREIHPFFDYEPDSELTAADRCHNLCPRPDGTACPECVEPGLEGAPEGKLACPECPAEINLRETNRLVGSVNDLPTRNFPHIHYCWEPTNVYSYPLYFEDHCLERYGHTRNYLLQPVFSVGLFAAQFVGLPYQMTIDPIAKKRYALGWFRPGQYVPYKYYQVPWNTEAAVVEAGVIAGSYFLFAPGVGP
jgi:hypothetical protein